MNRSKLNWLLAALAAITLTACSGNEEQTMAKPEPVHFESGDECHVCGMVISNFPGPKGEAITEKKQHVRKFCSTKDMFAWMLQPENENRDHTLYVHDMTQTEWEHPDDTALIDAGIRRRLVQEGRVDLVVHLGARVQHVRADTRDRGPDEVARPVEDRIAELVAR